MEVSAPRNALDLAYSGVVRALLPTFIGDKDRHLMRVTPPIAELAHDQWLVIHQDERYRPEIRMVIDRIYDVTSSLYKKLREIKKIERVAERGIRRVLMMQKIESENICTKSDN